MPVLTSAAFVKVPSPLPRRTLTLLPLPFATARSSWPSPLKSPTATDCGPLPAPTSAALVKVPSPLPSRTLTLLLPLFATARSSLPSASKSPTATEGG